ncbi:MAG: hypothetical protein LBS18_02520 [Clostridiales bacterium]|nr:hypothetical protein [Clostridiales bacterium]
MRKQVKYYRERCKRGLRIIATLGGQKPVCGAKGLLLKHTFLIGMIRGILLAASATAIGALCVCNLRILLYGNMARWSEQLKELMNALDGAL